MTDKERLKIKVLNFLFRFLPSHLIVTQKHSAEIDEFLFDCMESNEYFIPKFCTHVVRGKEIWTQNYPYAYGGIYHYGPFGPTTAYRCGSYVAWRLKRYLAKQERLRTKRFLDR